jgi:PAS domain-containing protein
VRREERPSGDDLRRRVALLERTGAQTPYQLFRVSRRNNTGKLALSGTSLLLYSGIFLWLYPSVGGATVALSLVPVALAARWLGLRAGVGIPFLTFVLHAFLFDLKEASGWTSVLRPESLAVGLASLVVGAVIGRLRDVYEQVTEVSEAEKGALESKLGEHGRAEDELRKSEERYRILSEASRDAVCLLTSEGRLIEANQAALDLFGYTREELMSLSLRQVSPDDGRG